MDNSPAAIAAAARSELHRLWRWLTRPFRAKTPAEMSPEEMVAHFEAIIQRRRAERRRMMEGGE